MKEVDKRIELIEACKRGDRKAQHTLYSDYCDAMYNVCLRMVKNEADAQDILQVSFIDVFRNLHKFKYESTPGSWIKRIVINNCINFFRKKKVHFEELKDYENYAEVEVPESDLTVDKVRRAMNELPEGYRTVVSLYLFEGYDHIEIADILGITVSTSKTQFFRAKKKMKSILSLSNENLYE